MSDVLFRKGHLRGHLYVSLMSLGTSLKDIHFYVVPDVPRDIREDIYTCPFVPRDIREDKYT